MALARLWLARGDEVSNSDCIQKAERNAQASDMAWLVGRVAACRARQALAQGNLDLATRWAEGCGLRVGDAVGYRRGGEYATLARVLITLGRPGEALTLLDWLLEVMERAGLTGGTIEAHWSCGRRLWRLWTALPTR